MTHSRSPVAPDGRQSIALLRAPTGCSCLSRQARLWSTYASKIEPGQGGGRLMGLDGHRSPPIPGRPMCENPVRPNRRGFPFWVQSSFELRPHLPPVRAQGVVLRPHARRYRLILRRQSHPRDPPQGYAEFQRTMAKKCLRTRLSSVCTLRHHAIDDAADLQSARSLWGRPEAFNASILAISIVGLRPFSARSGQAAD